MTSANPTVELLAAALHDQPENPLRAPQVAEHEEELQRLDAMATAPPYVSGHNRSQAMQRARQVRTFLATHAPKPIDGERQNTVKRLADQVMAEVIQPALLTRSEMQRNPAGSVGKHLRQEASKPAKRAVLTWKRAMRALDPQNDDPDFTNVERFRREGGIVGTSTFMADAQLPGVFAMTPAAKANWPLPEPTTTAVAQVRQREATRKPGRPPMSPEARKAAGARLAQARAAKAAARGPGSPGQRTPPGDSTQPRED
jgi:hypothetical protein